MLLGRCRAGDLARLDAGGADVQALGRTRDDGPNGLDVRVPTTASTDVRVRHVVAEARPLAANVADGSHGCLHKIGWLESDGASPGGDVHANAKLRQPAKHTGGTPPSRTAGHRSRIPRMSVPASMLPTVTTL